MTTRASQRPTPLPKGWTEHVRSALLHAIALATMALTVARSRAATSRSARRRLQAELDHAQTEIALLKEELEIKDSRWRRLPSRRRPHYTPIQRMRILQLKAARGWSLEQAARAFLVDEQTLRFWVQRVDEEGEGSLIQSSEPVNKFPDFVRYLVRQLQVLVPSMGKVRIAQVLARAGLHLGVTTVGRILKETEPVSDEAAEIERVQGRRVTARYPGHIWHIDLTTIPTAAGFWVPWLPFALPQSWPFCWWVAVVVDHFSRAVVGFAVFVSRPTSREIQRSLDVAMRRGAPPPRYIISDKGRQFWCDSYRQWCRRRAIRPRFGAVGKHGSIAIIERFIRSMKSECTRYILISATSPSHATRAHLLRDLVQLPPTQSSAKRTNSVRSLRCPSPCECQVKIRAPRELASKEPLRIAAGGDPGQAWNEPLPRRWLCGRQAAPTLHRAS